MSSTSPIGELLTTSPIADILQTSPMDDVMDFPLPTIDQLPAHLRSLRNARGMTQADLGRLLGVKQARIADIEKDPGSVSVAQMHRLLAALGVQLLLRTEPVAARAADASGTQGRW